MDVKSLPPFDEYSRCRACGYQRGPEVKPAVRFHDGEADGQGNSCELGGDRDHLHVTCLRCQFTWAEACLPDVPPLTVAEIEGLRALLGAVQE